MCKNLLIVIVATLCIFQSAIAKSIGDYLPDFDLFDIVSAGLTYQVGYLSSAKNKKNTHVVKNGKCDQIIFPLLELTEVCSSGGSRLYFSPYDTEIRGCYTIGKANTKSFADCCQLRYSPVNGAAPGTIYYKEFCSGRREKDTYKNPAEMNKYGISRKVEDLRLNERSSDVYEFCEHNYDHDKCRKAEEENEKTKDADVDWYSALSIWRYKNGITKVRRFRDKKIIKEIRE